MSDRTFCSVCGVAYSPEELTEVNDQLFCPDCLREETIVCSHCGQRILTDDNAGDSDTPLCQFCYDQYYISCAHCGRIVRMDDAFYENSHEDDRYCETCYNRLHRSIPIQNYYYKPTPIFYGTGPRFFGVELEIDEGGEFDTNARKLLELANSQGEERLYCKHDGSLEDGFELVTHPMSLAYHHQEMPWAELLKEAVSMGYLSHQTSTCGLHVHVSRNAFGSTQEEQDAAIARVLYFFEKHWEELLKFSRRSQRQLNQWASRYG